MPGGFWTGRGAVIGLGRRWGKVPAFLRTRQLDDETKRLAAGRMNDQSGGLAREPLRPRPNILIRPAFPGPAEINPARVAGALVAAERLAAAHAFHEPLEEGGRASGAVESV